MRRVEGWDAPSDWLADPDGLHRAYLSDSLQVLARWAQVEPTWREQIDEAAARLLATTSEDASGTPTWPVGAIGSLAALLYHTAHLDPAQALYQRAERIGRDAGDGAGLGRGRRGRAKVLLLRGRLEETLRLCLQAREGCATADDSNGLQQVLVLMGAVYLLQGRFDEAMALFREHALDTDIVITTALIPGRPAPKLWLADMVESMKAVIMELAVNETSPPVETGGLYHIFKRIP